MRLGLRLGWLGKYLLAFCYFLPPFLHTLSFCLFSVFTFTLRKIRFVIGGDLKWYLLAFHHFSLLRYFIFSLTLHFHIPGNPVTFFFSFFYPGIRFLLNLTFFSHLKCYLLFYVGTSLLLTFRLLSALCLSCLSPHDLHPFTRLSSLSRTNKGAETTTESHLWAIVRKWPQNG